MRILLAALLAVVPTLLHARPALEKPNLIVVFLDDAGYGDFSHTGNPSIHTPNLSRLVREGLNFPQFYCASPACSASRYSLHTGRNPARSGLPWVLGPMLEKHIHPDEVTIAEGLKDRGYATGFYGKWHLGTPNANNGMTPNALPLAHGFDTWEGTNVSNDYTVNNHLVRSNPAGKTPIPGYEILVREVLNDPAHDDLTRRYRERAVQFIESHAHEPFFLLVAPNMPHLPVHASAEFRGTSQRGLYGDCIEEIDAMVGTLVAKLESKGIAGNTLIVFTSDNGPWIHFEKTTSHERYGEARLLIGSALPFRDGKGSIWEGGFRMPGVWYWPGTIQPATVVRKPAATLDILPTIFALAGKPLPAGRTIDGRDIRPYLNPSVFPGTVPDFTFFYTGSKTSSVHAVRHGPWKLITGIFQQTGTTYGFTASVGEPLLFNVEQDPHERFDVSDAHPTVVSEMLSLRSNFLNAVASEGTFW